MLRTRVPLAGSVTVLGAAALGYVTAGSDGGVVAGVAVALGIGVIAGLAWTVGALVGRPDRTRPLPILAGGLVIAGWAAVPVSVLELSVPVWAYVGVISLVGILLGVRGDSPVGGLWHGTIAGGTGGVLMVYVAVYESFTTHPEMDGIVLIAGVFAPLAFAVVGGLGGVIGGVASLARSVPDGEVN